MCYDMFRLTSLIAEAVNTLADAVVAQMEVQRMQLQLQGLQVMRELRMRRDSEL